MGSAPTFPTSAEGVNAREQKSKSRRLLLGPSHRQNNEAELYAMTSSATNHHRRGGAGFVCEPRLAVGKWQRAIAGVRRVFSIRVSV